MDPFSVLVAGTHGGLMKRNRRDVLKGGSLALLGGGLLVVALLARLVGEEHDVDHLAEQLATPGRRRVPDAVELVHVLQGGDVVAQGDRAVAHMGEHLRRLFRRQRASGGSAVDRLGHGRGGLRTAPGHHRERKRTGPCHPTHPAPGLLREAPSRSLFWGVPGAPW